MARTIHRLTQKQIEHATKPINDGGNLWLYPQGHARNWFLRYMLKGKARQMALGAWPDVTLARARELASKHRKVLKSGLDPLEQRTAEHVKVPDFTICAARYIRAHRRSWSNPKHARQWVRTMKTYARPFVGEIPVDQITTEHVLAILQPIWTTKTETAKRVQGRVENVLDFAGAMKWRTGDNPARWRGHLDKLLASPTKVKRQRNGGTTRHHPAMPYTDLPAFMAELRGTGSVSSMALQWLILSATRTSETLGAAWGEIDLEARVWTVPASRMKAKREHRVPVTEPMAVILERLPRVVGNPHLFVGARHGKPLSNMALLQLMRGMGYGVNCDRGAYVPHGFRSSFRDWSGEASSYPRDVCEMALAHVIENKVEAAYRRGDLFAKRTAMMNAWAEWCSNEPAEAVLIDTRREMAR